MKKYVFRRYKESYPRLFKIEKDKLIKFLPKNVKIEHIGSTAVPSLGGKGIIDIIVGFKNRKEIKDSIRIMEQEGYEIMKGFNQLGRISFKKEYGLLFKRKVHIHFLIFNKKLWESNIKFRDRLRKSQLLIKEYENIKKEAVNLAKGNGEIYRRYKDAFIRKYSK